MKKVFYLLLVLLLMTSCSEESDKFSFTFETIVQELDYNPILVTHDDTEINNMTQNEADLFISVHTIDVRTKLEKSGHSNFTVQVLIKNKQ